MRGTSSRLLAAVFLSTTLSAVTAQEEFVDSFNARFLERQPRIGDQLPDADGYDIRGNKFSLKQTRGSFTVIVFGCLT